MPKATKQSPAGSERSPSAPPPGSKAWLFEQISLAAKSKDTSAPFTLNPSFLKCSRVISNLHDRRGHPIPLPTEVLPPLP
jgi:hypothetical protein